MKHVMSTYVCMQISAVQVHEIECILIVNFNVKH